MHLQGSLARLFDLSSSCFDLGFRRSRDLIHLHRQSLGDLTITKHLDERVSVLDDALGREALAIDHVTGLELLFETGDIDGQVLDTVDVRQAGELRETSRQSSLAALEACALAATSAGLLTVETATGRLAGAGTATAADALTCVP